MTNETNNKMKTKNLTNKLKNTWNCIKENPKKIAGLTAKVLLTTGFTALVATTAIKDNVYFNLGKRSFKNPQEDCYVWGLFSQTEIYGENVKGNIYTFGLTARNDLIGDPKKTKSRKACCSVTGSDFAYGSSKMTGNLNAYGLLGENNIWDRSKLNGNMNIGCLFGYYTQTN